MMVIHHMTWVLVHVQVITGYKGDMIHCTTAKMVEQPHMVKINVIEDLFP